MVRTVMIDLPSVMNGEGKIDSLSLISIIDDLQELKGVEIVFGESILEDERFFSYDDVEFSMLWSKLASVNTKSYTKNEMTKAQYIVMIPDLTSSLFQSYIADEIKLQANSLHNGVNTLFIVGEKRWTGDTANLITKKDHKEKVHTTIVTKGRSIENYVKKQRPILIQLKHGSESYSRGREYVSAFSAYDPRCPKEAEKLLQTAYDQYEGDDVFPNRLYAFDGKNDTYVEFRLSEARGYHGFDCKPEDVPPNIKVKLRH